MNETQQNLNRRLAECRHPGQRVRYPADLRKQVVNFANAELNKDRCVAAIARNLDLCQKTLRAWLETAAASTIDKPKVVGKEAAGIRMVSVNVADADTNESLILVTPEGYRLEGLDLSSAMAVLERLQ